VATSVEEKVSEAETSDQERLKALREGGVDTLIIGAPDNNGEFRSKRFALDLFAREEVEIGFSDYLFSCDVAEELMTPRPTYNGYFPTAATGLPDIFVRPDWRTLRVLPWEPDTAVVIGDYLTHEGEEMAMSPRGVLRRVAERLQGMGYAPMAGVEYEFMVFRANPDEARQQPVGLTPLHYGPAYGNARGAAEEPVLGMVRRMMDQAGIPVEAANPEAMPGQSEITIRFSDVMSAADNAFLYKHFVRELLAREGLTASFIAKYDPAGYGSSGHFHMSFRDGSSEGTPLLLDDNGELSDVASRAIAGFLATVKDFTAFYAPNVNSYRRFQMDHSFAGDTVSWGYDNRSCTLRVLKTTPGSTRIESRVPGADVNPYLGLAASFAGMAHGLESDLEAPEPVLGDAYAAEGIERIPNDLASAVELLDRSELAPRLLGEEFVRFYAETRFWEAEQHRLAMTPWELSRYL
jgi:glutamine synthetase